MKFFAISFIFTILSVTGTMAQNNTEYVYTDGSGNTYSVTENLVVYFPVKEKQSSSGMYSGGEPYRQAITKQDYNAFAALFTAAVADTGEQIENRLMGSALLKTQVNDAYTIVILKPGSPHISKIENWLKDHRP